MEAARACGKRVIAADAHGSASCYEADLSGGFALVAGNEGNGISSSFAEGADLIVRVPMAGGAESLNASIAAAVIMFEAMRQSRAADPQQGGHGFGQRTV
jgi:TrmH family RNA methyltransferase